MDEMLVPRRVALDLGPYPYIHHRQAVSEADSAVTLNPGNASNLPEAQKTGGVRLWEIRVWREDDAVASYDIQIQLIAFPASGGVGVNGKGRVLLDSLVRCSGSKTENLNPITGAAEATTDYYECDDEDDVNSVFGTAHNNQQVVQRDGYEGGELIFIADLKGYENFGVVIPVHPGGGKKVQVALRAVT